ncbi:unnamed protein product [Prorocentrum cordatum]|uniref:Uncharacterized protein n=1 Tax=Prorocentrum cordatum TaxID=2364126 RepID=A0ABN9RLJ7_9DINO|nr:unnamed protein product [Polarella glacialis]
MPISPPSLLRMARLLFHLGAVPSGVADSGLSPSHKGDNLFFASALPEWRVREFAPELPEARDRSAGMAPLEDLQARDLAWISDFIMQQMVIMMRPVMDHLHQTDAAVDHAQRVTQRLSMDISEVRGDVERTNKYVTILRQGLGVQNEGKCVLQRGLEGATRTVKRLDDQMESALGVVRGVEDCVAQLCRDVRALEARQEEMSQHTGAGVTSESVEERVERIGSDVRALKEHSLDSEAKVEACLRELRELRRGGPGILSDTSGRVPHSSKAQAGREHWPQKKAALTFSVDESSVGQEVVKGTRSVSSSTPLSAYKQALSVTTGPALKAILEAHIGQLKDDEISPEKCITPEESLRRATAAVRDAATKHDQAVSALLRAREVLEKATEREATAALTLAKAEKSKLQAVRALAELNGVVAKGTKDGHGNDGGDSKKLISISWDQDFFSTLDKLEVSEAERADLKQLETDLKGVRDLVGTKSSEVERMPARMAKMKEDIMVRLAKKRKGPDGAATGNPDGGGSGGEPGGARGGDDGRTAEATPVRGDQADAELAEEARRLSEAKLAAAQAAQGAGLGDK